ncbi:MAG: hypothetical protein GX587_11255 [Bacteroidales bacterium]|nr:hypothetical protein [Bacteroidales bacterium]
MKTYKIVHESKGVANKHIAKIKERGGNVKQSIKEGKILLEYSFDDNKIEDLIEATKIYINKKGYPLSHIYQDKNCWRSTKTTDELKKEVGMPISTELIYKKPNIVMPQYVKWDIAEYGRDILDKIKNIKITKIPISKIEFSQEFVFSKPLQKKLSNNDFVPLFKFEGKYYLNDGNHYVASMFLNGNNFINAKVIDVAS